MKKQKMLEVAAIITILLALTLTQISDISPAYAGDPEETHAGDAMWIEPSSIELSTDTVSVGYRFNITMWINLTVDSASWEFKLIYDKTLLKTTGCGYTGGGKSQFFENINTLALDPSFVDINVTHAYVLHAELWGMSGPYRGPGYGSLSWVEFEVMSVPPEGETYVNVLDIASSYPGDTYAQDPDQKLIPMSVFDAVYQIISPGGPPPPPETVLYVDPRNITDPTLTPSSTFTINITVDDVSDMKICEFNLTYDPNIIGWMGINVFKVQNQTPTTQMILNDAAGFIWVKLTYPTAVTTESSPLVTLLFHVEAYGATVLDLHDTQLTDSNGDPIPHETEDGLFITLIRDVAIIDVFTSRNWTYVGLAVNVTVIAKNLGNENETFTVTAYYDDIQIENATVENLPSGAEATLVFVWNTSDTIPCNSYNISAEASIVPYELNVTNNVYINGQVKVGILGDINGDGKVRIDDVLLAAEAFGSYPGHPRWNPDADLNGDNKVRVNDILLVAKNFGQNCPP